VTGEVEGVILFLRKFLPPPIYTSLLTTSDVCVVCKAEGDARAACVWWAMQNVILGCHVRCGKCGVRQWDVRNIVCSEECDCRAACILCAVQS